MRTAEATLRSQAELRNAAPHAFVEDDIRAVYDENQVFVGWPIGAERIFDHIARDYTVAILGAQLGDEGKGRIVDNKLEAMLKIPGVKGAYVVRYGGGSNAGHTIYTEDGRKVPLHQLPSGIMYPEAIGLMDSGMIIHMEDLRTEIEDAEDIVGDLREKLMLSEEAIMVTDLDRAMEVLNRELTEGRSAGGTGRAITIGYSDFLTRNEMNVKDLIAEDWEAKMAKRYDDYEKRFRDNQKDISTMQVPDLKATRKEGKAITRNVGTKQEFIDRLRDVRGWYLQREEQVPYEKRMIQNTFLVHQDLYHDMSQGVLFEGAQAIGLNAWLGRRKDVTSYDTSVTGVNTGTRFWKGENIQDRVGIFKIPYMSSVGSARMITDLQLPRTGVSEEEAAAMSQEQQNGLWIRNVANEKGTTSGRFRDICEIDLELMRYNIRMGGIEVLAGTHLDIARADFPIRVCTHYTDVHGKRIPYQPGVIHQEGLTPHYVELPGWDGESVARATKFEDLPENAQKFLAFIQRQTGTPIVFATTGPKRENALDIPGQKMPRSELIRSEREAKKIGMGVDKRGSIYRRVAAA